MAEALGGAEVVSALIGAGGSTLSTAIGTGGQENLRGFGRENIDRIFGLGEEAIKRELSRREAQAREPIGLPSLDVSGLTGGASVAGLPSGTVGLFPGTQSFLDSGTVGRPTGTSAAPNQPRRRTDPRDNPNRPVPPDPDDNTRTDPDPGDVPSGDEGPPRDRGDDIRPSGFDSGDAIAALRQAGPEAQEAIQAESQEALDQIALTIQELMRRKDQLQAT